MKKILFTALLAANVTAVHAMEDFWRYMTVSVTGTYTKSTNNGLSVGDTLTMNSFGHPNFPAHSSPSDSADGVMDGGRQWLFLDPGYEGDYALGLTYRFRGTPTRLFATYDHFRDDDSRDDVNIRNLGYEWRGLAPSESSDSQDPLLSQTLASANVHHRADEFRIGFVTSVPVHPRVTLDSSFFFEYDRVTRDINEEIDGGTLSNGRTLSTGVARRSTENSVRGWGPGLGAKTHVRPFHSRYMQNFGLFAGMKTILLYVHNDFDQEYSETSDNDFYSYDGDRTHSLVGKLDITFGIDMDGCMCSNIGRLPINLALGMRYMNMFNVFKNGNAAYNTIQPGTNHAPDAPYFRTFAANSGGANDWGRIGPFLQFRLGGSNRA